MIRRTHRDACANHGFENVRTHTCGFVADLSAPVMPANDVIFFFSATQTSASLRHGSPHASRFRDLSVLEQAHEVRHEICHCRRRLNVPGMGGLAESTQVRDNEMIIVLGWRLSHTRPAFLSSSCATRTLNSSIWYFQLCQRLGQPWTMSSVRSASGLMST